ncbi:MAG: phosphate transporter permease subunit PtsA [Euryarchaeota archaeon ADurb.BinA087]|nr:MAG: phosphate transporter permease subunit PtsA [Euryarchaeota archaeon ADurb.BinA087]
MRMALPDIMNRRATPAIRKIQEQAIGSLWFICAIFAVLTVCFILGYLFYNGYPAFVQIGLQDFLFGMVWNPTGSPPSYGILSLIVGTILVMIGAMVLAVPLGIASAIFISELAGPRLRTVIKPAVELLAGIPSVVYGFFGLVVLTNWIRVSFDVPTGETWLAGSILLGIMALPTIVSVSEDAINAVPREYKEGSLAIGATGWQTISKVIIPSALSGITAAVILGIGRAIGETMAVLMVTGNAAVVPEPIWNVLSPIRTLTATLGIETGEVPIGNLHYNALFAIAVVLLIITLIINLSATFILNRIRHAQTGSDDMKRLFSQDKSVQIRRFLLYGFLGLVLLLVAVAAGILPCLVLLLAVIVISILWKRVSAKITQKIAYSCMFAAVGIVLVVLAIILLDIIVKGLPVISWEFIFGYPSNLGRAGGIFPAIVGTIYLVMGAILIALPIGIGATIYLSEYTREGLVTKTIRTGVDLLNGTPSIVFGLFGFAFLVIFVGLGVSLLTGWIVLALMILPTIIRTSEEALKSIPNAVREGSLALGASKWQTIRKVVLPAAVPGIITGTILSIGRAAGETAPILFTAVVFSTRFLPNSIFEPVMALPYYLYILSTSIPGAKQYAYGTALVLLVIVTLFYGAAVLLRTRFQKSIRW